MHLSGQVKSEDWDGRCRANMAVVQFEKELSDICTVIPVSSIVPILKKRWKGRIDQLEVEVREDATRPTERVKWEGDPKAVNPYYEVGLYIR